MAKKLIKRYLPDPNHIKSHRSLTWMGTVIHDPNLWHLNRRSVSLAFFVGLFFAFLPLPIQMPMAAGLAIAIKANLPVSVSLVWVTNPITMAPIFYFAYRVGSYILQLPSNELEIELTGEWLSAGLAIWQPLIVGCIICGILSGVIGYIAVRLLWRWHVLSNWQKRKAKRNDY